MKIETRKRKRATQKVKQIFLWSKGRVFCFCFSKGHLVILLVIRSALLLALE